MHLVGVHQWEQEKETYLLEASAIVRNAGENNYPHYFDHQHIKAFGDLNVEVDTPRSRALLSGFDLWYNQLLFTDRIGQSFDVLKPAPRAYLNIKE